MDKYIDWDKLSQFECIDSTSDNIDSFYINRGHYNHDEMNSNQLPENVGRIHENNCYQFLINQIIAQSHLDFDFGTSDPLLLPVPDAIQDKIDGIYRNLRQRLARQDIKCKIGSFSKEEFNLKHLSDRSNLQVDFLIRVRKRERHHSDLMQLSDNVVTYQLQLPCVILVEGTHLNYSSRLFEKFLRGTVSTAHLVNWPSIFFNDLDSRNSLQQFSLYYFVVTCGRPTEGMNNMARIHNTIFDNNDEIYGLLKWKRFNTVNINSKSNSDGISSSKKQDLESCLALLPFGLLNLRDLDLYSEVKLVDSTPKFKYLNSENDRDSIARKNLKKIKTSVISAIERVFDDKESRRTPSKERSSRRGKSRKSNRSWSPSHKTGKSRSSSKKKQAKKSSSSNLRSISVPSNLQKSKDRALSHREK